MKQTDAFKYARIAARVADQKLGEEILALDVRDESSVADCFLFVSGTTHVHIRALEDAIREELRKEGASLLRTDGQRGHLWRALDYGLLIVHLMDKKTREFYGMERLWEKPKPIDWKAPASKPATKKVASKAAKPGKKKTAAKKKSKK